MKNVSTKKSTRAVRIMGLILQYPNSVYFWEDRQFNMVSKHTFHLKFHVLSLTY